VTPWSRYAQYSIFNDGGRPPSWIFNSSKFYLPVRFGERGGAKCVPIGQTVLYVFLIFDFSRWRPSAILDFQKFKILTVCPIRRPNFRHRAKFHADRSIGCRDARFSIFPDSDVRYLEFLKVENFTCMSLCRANMRHYAKFRGDWSNHSGYKTRSSQMKF